MGVTQNSVVNAVNTEQLSESTSSTTFYANAEPTYLYANYYGALTNTHTLTASGLAP